ncbi:hypothetical protein GCM10023191_091750 [Actinoallomurus oryzae]|uniref:Uncharacterized protein n=1 Tax=Actinoallomurus oryzae TaxID=502180 RepID=A0ABP8R4V1_9ACTN
MVTQTAMMTAVAARHLPRTRERGRCGVAIRDILQASGAGNGSRSPERIGHGRRDRPESPMVSEETPTCPGSGRHTK